MSAVQEVPDVREYPAADRDGAADPAGAASLGRALVTPDTDGRWTLAVFVAALLLCALVYAWLWFALMPPAPAVDWGQFPAYRGWEARP